MTIPFYKGPPYNEVALYSTQIHLSNCTIISNIVALGYLFVGSVLKKRSSSLSRLGSKSQASPMLEKGTKEEEKGASSNRSRFLCILTAIK